MTLQTLTTQPQLTADDKEYLSRYIINALKSETLSAYTGELGYTVPRLVLFSKSKVVTVGTNDYWHMSDTKIYLGNSNGNNVPVERILQVLVVLSQFVDASEELEKAKTQAVLNHVLGVYRDMSKAALIESPVPMEGLAFSDEQVAALLGGEWMLPNGEVVDVTGEGWKVCATRLPEAPVAAAAVKAELVVDRVAEILDAAQVETPEVEF